MTVRVCRAALAGLAGLSLSSCAYLSDKVVAPRLAAEPFHAAAVENSLPANEPLFTSADASTRDPQYAIALSGGGLRSSLYNFGALKALYDHGLLGKADYLSSVSGGSYLSYLLYSNQMSLPRDGAQRWLFGAPSYDDSLFLHAVCERMANANFVTYGAMGKSLFAPRKLYSERLGVVYGYRDKGATPKVGRLYLDDLKMPVLENGWPRPIINATMYDPEGEGWHNALVEMTPFGSRVGDEPAQAWSSERRYRLRQSIAASGAAFATLLHRGFPDDPGDGEEIRLHDGGGSENLGVVALIRRGVPHILVIDAEHDNDYAFGAYRNLKNRLPYWGATIEIPELEKEVYSKVGRLPKKSAFSGFIYSGLRDGKIGRMTQIDYLKMSVTEDLKEKFRQVIANGTGKEQHEAFQDAMGIDTPKETYNCAAANNVDLNLTEWFTYATASYEAYRNDKLLPRKLNTLGFPQYSTIDQSYKTDQALAFIGLGYLQTLEYIENRHAAK